MKFSSVVVAAFLIASSVAFASDESALKISVDGGLSEIADLQPTKTDITLQESVQQRSLDSIYPIVVDTESIDLGSIEQELVEIIKHTSNEADLEEVLDELLQAAVIEGTGMSASAGESALEEIKLTENSEVESEIIPKGSNAGGIPTKVDTGVCVDRHPEECVLYVARGECNKNPGWMTINW